VFLESLVYRIPIHDKLPLILVKGCNLYTADKADNVIIGTATPLLKAGRMYQIDTTTGVQEQVTAESVAAAKTDKTLPN
jgi:hypothetical protein